MNDPIISRLLRQLLTTLLLLCAAAQANGQRSAEERAAILETLLTSDSIPEIVHALGLVSDFLYYYRPDDYAPVAYRAKSRLDSLKLDKSARALVTGNLAIAHGYGNEFDSAIYYMEQVLPMMPPCKGNECWMNFWTYGNLFEWYALEEAYQKTIMLADSIISIEGIDDESQSFALTNRSTAFREIGDYENALIDLRRGLEVVSKDAPAEVQSNMMRQISELYTLMDQREFAETWAKRSVTKAREALRFDSLTFLQAAYNYGSILRHAGQSAAAVELLEEALSIADKATALFVRDWRYIVKAGTLDAYLEMPNASPATITQRATELTAALKNDKDFDSPRVHLSILKTLSNYHVSMGENALAVALAKNYLDAAMQATEGSAELVRGALENLHQIESATGDLAAAYATLMKLRRYDSELSSRTQKTALARASVNLDLSENERARIAAEQAAELERIASANKSRTFLLALSAAIIILGILGWFYYRAREDRKLIQRKNSLISQSLAEKEALLREIHHRVKNNLQIISSLLQKQARVAGDGDARRLAREGQERIQSMALIHENLYQSEQLSGVNIRSYLTDLGANIARSHAAPGTTIDLQLDVEDLHLDLDTAIPVGLILNELLTNAYKYAFPRKDSGTIQVAFRQSGEQFNLEVNDDGVGLPSDHAERSKQSLGHNLVRGLVRQLEGTIEWLKADQGTRVKISF